MGLWERLLGVEKKEEPPVEETLEWKKIPEFLRKEEEARLEPRIPEALRLMREINAGFGELKREISGLFRKPIDSQQLQRIAVQMRENYVKRAAQAADEIQVPAEPAFENVEAFHEKLLGVLTALNKSASDNRYLIGFYKQDFERLAEIMKPIARQTDELREWLEATRPAVQAFEAANKTWEEGERLRNEIIKWERKSLELEGELKLLPVSGASDEDSVKKKLEENSLAQIDAEGRLSRAKSEAVGPIIRLQRLLRKYEHACGDKKKAADARQYSENAWQALKEDSGQRALRLICAEMSELANASRLPIENKEKGALDDLRQVLSSDSFAEKIAEADAAEARLAELRDSGKAFERLLAEENERARRKSELEKRIESEKAEAEEARKTMQATVAKTQDAVATATGKDAVIIPPKPAM